MIIRVGTRGSLLVTTQTQFVIDRLSQLIPNSEFELVTMLTTGDKKQGLPPETIRDKKEWIIELEEALIHKQIDIAVHSSKDVPIDIASGTSILPALEREDSRDVIVLSKAGRKKIGSSRLKDLSEPILLGTSSLRRETQLKRINERISCKKIRGNITTRINTLGQSAELDGVVLAISGINRLGINDLDYYFFDLEEMIPAVNQGILLVQFRESDQNVREPIKSCSSLELKIIWEIERQIIEKLGADCRSAVGVYAKINDGILTIQSRIVGKAKSIEHLSEGETESASKIASKHADTLLAQGARELL